MNINNMQQQNSNFFLKNKTDFLIIHIWFPFKTYRTSIRSHASPLLTNYQKQSWSQKSEVLVHTLHSIDFIQQFQLLWIPELNVRGQFVN